MRGGVSIGFAALLALIPAVVPAAAAAEEIAVPTTATINKGRLVDIYPGSPPPGSTDLITPFSGKISTGNPACRIRRPYQLGKVEPDGEFNWVGATTAEASGKWSFGLAGEPPEPMSIAIRVLPKTTVRGGTTYLCEEAISSTVPFDESDFTSCLIARAELRGYLPGVRRLKREIRAVKATASPDEMARKRQLEKRLKDFQAQHDSIQRTAQNGC
jgi:hypothetical protein